jgi:hypothetical protein
MDEPNVDAAADAERSVRRRLHEFEETQQWTHHVGDLDSGQLITTELDRPVTPLSRAERLSRLGSPFDPSIFGGPKYRLTPRRPYQAAPEAWMRASGPSMFATDSSGFIMWTTPRDVESGFDPDSMHFLFAESPVGRSLLTISVSGRAWPGTVGHILVASPASSGSIHIPIGETFADHTVDLTAFPVGGPVEAFIFILAGIQQLLFRSIDFRHAPVLDPGVF